MHVLLMEHIDGKELRILVHVCQRRLPCTQAHHHQHGLKPESGRIRTWGVSLGLSAEERHLAEPWTTHGVLREGRLPGVLRGEFGRCSWVLVDLENVGLGDLMKKLRKQKYRAKVVNQQRRRYLKRWLENEIQQWGQWTWL